MPPEKDARFDTARAHNPWIIIHAYGINCKLIARDAGMLHLGVYVNPYRERAQYAGYVCASEPFRRERRNCKLKPIDQQQLYILCRD